MTYDRLTWINCSDRLPVREELDSPRYLCTLEYESGKKGVEIGDFWLDGRWTCDACDEYGIKYKVIAWMPLPEPYGGK